VVSIQHAPPYNQPGRIGDIVLRFFFKALRWRRTRSSGAAQDETVRVQGVKHVLGLGTGEIFHSLEIHRFRSYACFEDFVLQPGRIVFDIGANSGVYTVRGEGRMFMPSRNLDCYRRLCKSVHLNGRGKPIPRWQLREPLFFSRIARPYADVYRYPRDRPPVAMFSFVWRLGLGFTTRSGRRR
jgi:hypothetical protein